VGAQAKLINLRDQLFTDTHQDNATSDSGLNKKRHGVDDEEDNNEKEAVVPRTKTRSIKGVYK
jgi:hypothetical protein